MKRSGVPDAAIDLSSRLFASEFQFPGRESLGDLLKVPLFAIRGGRASRGVGQNSSPGPQRSVADFRERQMSAAQAANAGVVNGSAPENRFRLTENSLWECHQKAKQEDELQFACDVPIAPQRQRWPG